MRQPKKRKRPSRREVVTSGIAHNLNNLMGVIVSRTNLLFHKVRDSRVLSEIDLIRKVALEASDMVQRLKNPTMSVTHGKRAWVDVNQLLKQVVEMTKPRWKGKGFSLNLKRVPKIYVSASALREVFINMILNAVDALKQKKSKQKHSNLTIRTFIDGDTFKVIFSDSGVGMNKQTLKRAFDPFFTTKGRQGSGLGLTTSREIIKNYKGTLDVMSTKGAGTTFVITFPIPKKFKTRKKSKAKKGMRSRKSIMLVDDERDFREAMAELLSLEGYEVADVGTGIQALKHLKRKTYDVVLSDVHMPRLSGYALAKKIKSFKKRTKVILLSGLHDATRMTRDVDGWITKPCNIEEMREVIERVCH